MPSMKTIEARLPVVDVSRSAEFFVAALGFEIGTLWPKQAPELAILNRDGLRLQLGRKERADSECHAPCAIWIDVEDLAALHSKVKEQTEIEWGPEVYAYGRREFGFRDLDGNLVILSEVTSGPPSCA